MSCKWNTPFNLNCRPGNKHIYSNEQEGSVDQYLPQHPQQLNIYRNAPHYSNYQQASSKSNITLGCNKIQILTSNRLKGCIFKF